MDGEPFNFYATSVSTVANISWNDILNLFTARFGHSEVPPMTAAIRRRLRKDKTIRQFYDDKIKDLRRAQLPATQMADVQTEGLPEAYRPYFYGRRFQAPSQWLEMALDIENDMGKHRGQTSKPKPSTSHCQADIRHYDRKTLG